MVLDVGCGNGPLRAALPDRAALLDQGPPWLVGLDASRRMLLDHPPPVVLADAVALPLMDSSFEPRTRPRWWPRSSVRSRCGAGMPRW